MKLDEMRSRTDSDHNEYQTEDSCIDYVEQLMNQQKPDVYYLAGASPVEKPVLRMALKRAGIDTVALNRPDAIILQLSSK